MNRILSLFVIFLLFQSSQAQTSALDEIRESGVIAVGTTADYMPFSYRVDGEYRGFDTELIEMAAEKLGVKVRFVPTTWSSLTNDMEEGRFHVAVGGITRTLERQASTGFTDPIFEIGKCPLVRTGEEAKFATLEQVNRPEVVLAVNRGGTNESFARQHLKKATILLVEQNLSIPELLATGKADVMLTDNLEAVNVARVDPRLVAVSPDKPWTHETLGFMTSRDDQPLLNWLNLFLEQAKADGTLEELQGKYGL
jgi:cyclohexadienyl dehydratase